MPRRITCAVEASGGQIDKEAASTWLSLRGLVPTGVTHAEIIGRMAGTGVGTMPSDAFTVSGDPTEVVRVCLWGQIQRSQLHDAMGLLAYIMSSPD